MSLLFCVVIVISILTIRQVAGNGIARCQGSAIYRVPTEVFICRIRLINDISAEQSSLRKSSGWECGMARCTGRNDRRYTDLSPVTRNASKDDFKRSEEAQSTLPTDVAREHTKNIMSRSALETIGNVASCWGMEAMFGSYKMARLM